MRFVHVNLVLRRYTFFSFEKIYLLLLRARKFSYICNIYFSIYFLFLKFTTKEVNNKYIFLNYLLEMFRGAKYPNIEKKKFIFYFILF